MPVIQLRNSREAAVATVQLRNSREAAVATVQLRNGPERLQWLQYSRDQGYSRGCIAFIQLKKVLKRMQCL